MSDRKEEVAHECEEKTPAAESGRRHPQEPAAPADSSLLPSGNAAPDPEHPPEKPTRSSAA
jgi:hypothetical protein